MQFGLIFDVDGVLADTEELVARASVEMFQRLYGREVTVEDFRPFIGTGPHRYVEGVAEKHGIDIDVEEAVAVRHECFMQLMESGEYIGFPGALPLIEAAADEPEWRLAIATSSQRQKAEPALVAAGIPIELFDAVITGDVVTRRKPDPEIYLLAADALELAPPQCVGVEDAVQGVTAVKAAQMKCVAVTNSFPAVELREADMVVPSLEDVTLDKLKALLLE